MTTELQKAQHATPEQAARMTASLLDLRNQPVTTSEEAKQVSLTIEVLSTPATRKWVAGRVATLLSQYFASSVPTEVMAAVADDWQHELAEYPAWAISNACRWWMGAENPDRRKKPLPGDISARSRDEMETVRFARLHVERFEKHGYTPPAPQLVHDRTVDLEGRRKRADEIVKAAGYAKRIGGRS